MQTSRIAVVGGGLLGSTAAIELRRRGHAVVLIDGGPLPRPNEQASSIDRSRAVRMDYGADTFYVDLAARAIELWRSEWNERFGERLYAETGFLFGAARSLSEPGFEADSYHTLRARDVPVERLTGAAAASRFQALGASLWVDGYFNPHAGVARAGRTVELLLREAARLGVELRGATSLASTVEAGGRVVGIETTDGRRLLADAVLLATGAWTPALLPDLADALQAVAQTVHYLRPADPTPFAAASLPTWAFDIGGLGWYGFPADDGLVKVAHHGPGERKPPTDRQPDRALEARLRAFLREALPALADAPVAERKVCFYCDSRDGDFWIDAVPGREGLFVAAGGSGHAFKFAPLLGGWIADTVEGCPDPALRRFRWRSPRDGREPARTRDLPA